MARVGAWGFLGAILLGGLIFGAAELRAQSSEAARVVEGRVVNMTPDGESVGGLTAVLHRVDGAERDDMQTSTDSEGGFHFDTIEFDPRMSYGVSVVHHGGLYGTDLDLSQGSPPPVTLTVYDATDSDSVLSLSSASILFASVDKASQTIFALEIVAIANDSNTAYVPGPEPMNLIRFGLPAGASGLEVDSRLVGAQVVQVERGFALDASVPPGEHSVMFAYYFPYSGGELEFSRGLRYGARSLRVLAPYGVARMSSQQLSEAQLVDIGGQPYHVLEGSNIPRGQQLTVLLGALPQASLAESVRRRLSDARLEYAAALALGLLMAFLIAFALWRGSAGRSGEIAVPAHRRERSKR